MATIERRTTPDGEASFRVKVRLKGFPPQSATFTRITDARKWAQHTESAIREGRHFKTAEAKRHTLGDLVDRYIRDVIPLKPKNGAAQRRQLEWWKRELGAFTLADITPAVLAERRDLLLRGTTSRGTVRSPATAVRYLAALSHAFTLATREWGWLESSPMSKVSKPKEPRGRVRFLSESERTRLLDVCRSSPSPYLYTAVVVALATGMRKGELMSMSWDDIDFKRGRVVLQETKNGERRGVPLGGHAREVLHAAFKARGQDTDLVFPGQNPRKPIDIRAAWECALREAKLKDFRFHDLRHSAASYLAMNGASIVEIAEVLGHRTLSMVKRYSHLSEGHTSQVVARMNDKIFSGGNPR